MMPKPSLTLRTAVFAFVLVIVLPFLFLFVESLRSETGAFTLSHLDELWLSGRQLTMMKTSLVLSGAAAAGAVLLGVPYAFLIEKTDMVFKGFFRLCAFLPILIPPYVHAMVRTQGVGPGKYHTFELPFAEITVPSVYSVAGGVWVFAFAFFPFVALIAAAGFRAVDNALEETALTAKKAFSVVRRVTLPLAAPHILSGAILVFVFTFVNFEVPDILRLKVYPIEIFIQFSAYYDEKAATILSIPLIAVSLLLIWGQMRYMKGKSYVTVGRQNPTDPVYRLGAARWPACLYPLAVVSYGAFWPLIVLAEETGSFGDMAKVAAQAADPIATSLWTALAAAFVMAVFSFMAAYYLVRGAGRLRSAADYLSQLPLGVPSIVLGIGLINVWNRPVLGVVYDSAWILVLAYVCAYSPFVIKISCAQLMNIDRHLEEVAGLATKSRLKIVGRIVLPLAAPGLFAGFATAFVLSVSNLGTALLVTAPGTGTVPISIYNYLHYGAKESVYALSVIMLALMAIILALVFGAHKLAGRMLRVNRP